MVHAFSFQPFPSLAGLPGAGSAMNSEALLEGFFLPPGMYITVYRTAVAFYRVFYIYISFFSIDTRILSSLNYLQLIPVLSHPQKETF